MSMDYRPGLENVAIYIYTGVGGRAKGLELL